jgi:hypothetical protein
MRRRRHDRRKRVTWLGPPSSAAFCARSNQRRNVKLLPFVFTEKSWRSIFDQTRGFDHWTRYEIRFLQFPCCCLPYRPWVAHNAHLLRCNTTDVRSGSNSEVTMLPFRLLLCSDERTSRDAERESGLPPAIMAGINGGGSNVLQLMTYRHRPFGRSGAQEQLDVRNCLCCDVGHRSFKPPDLRRDRPDPEDLLV